MKIGAASLIRAWGRPMTLKRDGVVFLDFIGKRFEFSAGDAAAESLDYSADQEVFNIIVAYEDLLGIVPQKFDVIVYNGNEYTVQRSRTNGADEEEVTRMLVKGGLT